MNSKVVATAESCVSFWPYVYASLWTHCCENKETDVNSTLNIAYFGITKGARHPDFEVSHQIIITDTIPYWHVSWNQAMKQDFHGY